MPELTQKEKDIAYAQGFIGAWIETAPAIVKSRAAHGKEWIVVLIDGVDHYREKCAAINEDYQSLLTKFNQLTAMSAGYLQLVGQQKELIDQQIAERPVSGTISDDIIVP